LKFKDVVTDAMGFQEISSRNNSFLEVNSDYYHCYYYNYCYYYFSRVPAPPYLSNLELALPSNG